MLGDLLVRQALAHQRRDRSLLRSQRLRQVGHTAARGEATRRELYVHTFEEGMRAECAEPGLGVRQPCDRRPLLTTAPQKAAVCSVVECNVQCGHGAPVELERGLEPLLAVARSRPAVACSPRRRARTARREEQARSWASASNRLISASASSSRPARSARPRTAPATASARAHGSGHPRNSAESPRLETTSAGSERHQAMCTPAFSHTAKVARSPSCSASRRASAR